MIILTHEILDLVTDNNAFVVLVRSIAKRASYSGNSCFPSLRTISKDTGLSKPTVIKACKWLKDKDLIQVVQRENPNGGLTSNWYVINTELIKIVGNLKSETLVKNFDHPSKGDLPPLVKEIDSNHKPNLTNKKKEKKFDAELYVESLDLNSEYKEAILGWLEIRKVKKVPTTQRAIDQNLSKLESLKLQDKIKCINESIANGWQGLFPDRLQGVSMGVKGSIPPSTSKFPPKVIYAATEADYLSLVESRCANYGSDPSEFRWVKQAEPPNKNELAKGWEEARKQIGKIDY